MVVGDAAGAAPAVDLEVDQGLAAVPADAGHGCGVPRRGLLALAFLRAPAQTIGAGHEVRILLIMCCS